LKIILFHFPGGSNEKYWKEVHPIVGIRAGVSIESAKKHYRGEKRSNMEKNAFSFFYHFLRHNPTQILPFSVMSSVKPPTTRKGARGNVVARGCVYI